MLHPLRSQDLWALASGKPRPWRHRQRLVKVRVMTLSSLILHGSEIELVST
jgi:hypothetical protein